MDKLYLIRKDYLKLLVKLEEEKGIAVNVKTPTVESILREVGFRGRTIWILMGYRVTLLQKDCPSKKLQRNEQTEESEIWTSTVETGYYWPTKGVGPCQQLA